MAIVQHMTSARPEQLPWIGASYLAIRWFCVGGFAPVAMRTFEHVIIGGGPLIGYRSAGRQSADGAIVLSGASIPLDRGLALNIAAPVSMLFAHRRTVSVSVAIGVAKVF
jgi:hypothetical protein